MKYKMLILSLLLVLSSPIFATGPDVISDIYVIGFSKDGKFLAYERYDPDPDPSGGTYYSEIFIVNVLKNKFVRKSINLELYFEPDKYDDEEVSEEPIDKWRNKNIEKVRNKNIKKASPYLKRYRIVKGNSGKQVVSSIRHYSNNGLPSERKVNFKVGTQVYKLILKEIKIKTKDCKWSTYKPTKIFELKLVRNKKSKILQRDRRLPKSRGCPSSYSIHSAYIYKNKIAVFINAQWGHQGFNYSVKQVVVTGTLP